MTWKLTNVDIHGIDAADQETERKAKLKPAIAALYKTAYKTANKLDYLNKRLFELCLLAQLDLKSHKQTAWIKVITPTIPQAKADEAAGKLPPQDPARHPRIVRSTSRPACPTTPPSCNPDQWTAVMFLSSITFLPFDPQYATLQKNKFVKVVQLGTMQ